MHAFLYWLRSPGPSIVPDCRNLLKVATEMEHSSALLPPDWTYTEYTDVGEGGHMSMWTSPPGYPRGEIEASECYELVASLAWRLNRQGPREGEFDSARQHAQLTAYSEEWAGSPGSREPWFGVEVPHAVGLALTRLATSGEPAVVDQGHGPLHGRVRFTTGPFRVPTLDVGDGTPPVEIRGGDVTAISTSYGVLYGVGH